MIATPTTTVTILGGTSTSPYGDEEDGTTEIAANVPCAIAEGVMRVATESDPQARAIRYFTGRLPHGTAVAGNQRLRDERTGDVYMIDSVMTPTNHALPMDVRVDLRRVTS